MAAIDLLFDVNLQSERLHQIVLPTIFLKTNFLSMLGINAKPLQDFNWEPGNRKFDLSIELEDKSILWIEIKVDSSLGKDQLERQLDFIKRNQSSKSNHVYYLFLGLVQYWSDVSSVQLTLDQNRPQNCTTVKVITSNDFINILENKNILPNIEKENRDIRDLIVSYREALLRLESRTNQFEKKTVKGWDWGPDYFGFYENIRKYMPTIEQFGLGFVPNPSGGFPGCWFHWRTIKSIPIASIYLQLERDILCFKIEVDGKSNYSSARNNVYEMVKLASNNSFLDINKPDRFGTGNTMTVACVRDFITQSTDHKIDWNSIKIKLNEAIKIVNEVSSL